MKAIQHLSPTSISLFKSNIDEFYIQYLADQRPPRLPQTAPMAVGSSFDAYAKSFLHEKIFGKGFDPKFDFNTLFEAQVESQNRDQALIAGKRCFEVYQKSGALADLMLDISRGIGKPRFELEIKGIVNGYREGITKETDGVTLLGKPDLFYLNKEGAHVILDWKVNGYYSNYPVSPMAGYVKVREENGVHKGAHKDAIIMSHNGIMINHASYLEDNNNDWARQLSIYAWLLGEEIGSDFIVAIDQLVCGPGKPIRIAEHRSRVNSNFQWEIFAEAQEIWEIVHSDYIFRNLTYEQSVAKQQYLDGVGSGEASQQDLWFFQACRDNVSYKK